MSIRYQCTCGAEIRLPSASAGRKAKCKACGTIFKVPQLTGTAAAPRPAAPVRPGVRDAGKPGSWLDDLAHSETQAECRPVVLDLSDLPPEPPAGPSRLAANEGPGPAYVSPEDERDWITGPKRSFWVDLLGSFVFFLDGGNLATFVALCLINAVSTIPFVGCFMFLLTFFIGAYIQVFLLSTVRETASGEDQLPGVWISSFWEDLILPALQLAGTWIFVMLPAVALAIWSWVDNRKIELEVFNMATAWQGHGIAQAAAIMTLVGQSLWPAVVLAVAIGGTFAGLWPHVVVRTALCAPLPYLAICAAIVVASVLAALPHTAQFAGVIKGNSWTSAMGLEIIANSMWLYASIVEMRAIGLYYRHYKHRLPWVAE